jgi:AAA+ superfamily predicted ATPase
LDDNDELNLILTNKESARSRPGAKTASPLKILEIPVGVDMKEGDEADVTVTYTQWTSHDSKTFFPATRSCGKLTPGFYLINHNNGQIFFRKERINSEELVRFEDSNIDKVITEIEKFWEREEIYGQFDLAYKRGILMWGPPGTGKTCTVRLVMEDVIRRGGIVVNFTNPALFNEGMKLFREIQPDTPCVVLMEDIDSIMDTYCESDVINVLDGVQRISKVVFLATTNYPDRLGARVVNRPSRFDKRYKIGNLNLESRKIYFQHLFDRDEKLLKSHDIERWASDTDGLSVAHLKELFVSVVIIGDTYDDAINVLQKMRDQIKDEDKGSFGFVR